MITFRIVDTSEVGRAHAWHSGFAAANDAIFPRTEKTFGDLALERLLWCAISDADDFVGMSYSCVNDSESEVEVGGLMVAGSMRGKGIGDILMRLPLAHFLVNERPLNWLKPPQIVSHALKDNPMPRRIIARAGFVHAQDVKIPGDRLPGLRTAEDGYVHGSEFHLRVPDAIATLAAWLDSWSDTLRDSSSAKIDMREDETLQDWASVLRSMI